MRCWLLIGSLGAVLASDRHATSEAELVQAFQDGVPRVCISGTIILSRELYVSSNSVSIYGIGAESSLNGQDVVVEADDVRLSNFRVERQLRVVGSSSIAALNLTVGSGVFIKHSRGVDVGFSDIANANGTCVQVAACGNSSTFESCNITIHDNYVHDCRANGGSPYAPGAQGILLGGDEGSSECTVGVIVRNNDVRGIDEMGIRINNNNYGSCINNLVTLNRVTDWGQLPGSAGGDNTDSGCLYTYGHWYSPGNVLLYNECVSTNRSWGQNGVYLDDASSGQVVIGNVFRGAVAGSPIKLNGGAYNTIHSNLVIGGVNLGFGNCRGLRGITQQWYTCPNYPKWMAVLQGDNYLSEPWASAFPWYKGWCSNTTAGPDGVACAPAGAPAGYCCEVLSRGNDIRMLAGVWMNSSNPQPFQMLTAPGFPSDPAGHCPTYVVNASFNSIDWASVDKFYSTDQFVNASAGDYTVRPDSAIYQDMPDFARIPYTSIGPGSPQSRAHEGTGA